MELFLHPWYMIAGGALVSSPIIIHLINRMRFKRIRWAAMEFLLKSQKRNRRRLIIEQMILLLLRILLVLLVGFLVARFVGSALGNTSQGTMHIVVLDDTLSMGDRWQQGGEARTSFEVGKDQIQQLARQAVLASSAQNMKVYLLSDLESRFKLTDGALTSLRDGGVPDNVLSKLKPLQDKTFENLDQYLTELARVTAPDELEQFKKLLVRHAAFPVPRYDARLGSNSEDELKQRLAGLKPAALHIDPIVALLKGQEVFNTVAQGQKILHFVSDFRNEDWNAGSQVKELKTALTKLTEAGINLSLMDTAHPFRNQTNNIALHHDNLAIVDFRAETRMAAEGVPVEFTATIKNFGSKDQESFLKVWRDGQRELGLDQPIDSLPAGQTVEKKLNILFEKKKSGPEFVHVSVQINREEGGLEADNVRDLVIELRKKIPALVVDGLGREGQRAGGDSFHLDVAFLSTRKYEAEFKTLEELEKLNLKNYPSIYLVNVPQIRSEPLVQKLRDYVQNGGSLAFFLGEKVIPSFYNDTLFKKYNGLFPLLIAPRPSEPLPPEEREARKQEDPQPKILFRDKDHPVVKGWQESLQGAYRYLMIDRYYPALPRSQWEDLGDDTKKVEEIITLPNRKSVDDYKARAQELGKEVEERAEALAGDENKTEPERLKLQQYLPALREYRRQIRNALTTPYLHQLVVVLDNLLNDEGDKNNPNRPKMMDLWAEPGMKALASQIATFRDTVKYGDPLVLARRYGQGRVVAVLTTAGTAARSDKEPGWNEWGAGSVASPVYVPFIKDLQGWLTSSSDDLNRIVTDDANIKLEFDAGKYQEEVGIHFLAQTDPEAKKGAAAGERSMKPKEEPSGRMVEKDKMLTFTFRDAKRPGVYFFEFKPAMDGVPPVTRTYAFNVDAAAESDLKRADSDKLERKTDEKDSRVGKVMLFSPGDPLDRFKNREPDASESPWLYLLFILILVVEQALAVHLSFHLKGSDLAAPSARPAMAPAAA